MKVIGTIVLFIRICVSRWRISWFYAAPTLGVGVFMSFLFFVLLQIYVMFLKLQNIFEMKSNFFR